MKYYKDIFIGSLFIQEDDGTWPKWFNVFIPEATCSRINTSNRQTKDTYPSAVFLMDYVVLLSIAVKTHLIPSISTGPLRQEIL